jgi:hypothetical protein
MYAVMSKWVDATVSTADATTGKKMCSVAHANAFKNHVGVAIRTVGDHQLGLQGTPMKSRFEQHGPFDAGERGQLFMDSHDKYPPTTPKKTEVDFDEEDDEGVPAGYQAAQDALFLGDTDDEDAVVKGDKPKSIASQLRNLGSAEPAKTAPSKRDESRNPERTSVAKEDLPALVLAERIYDTATVYHVDTVGSYKIDTQIDRSGVWIDHASKKMIIAVRGTDTMPSVVEIGAVYMGFNEIKDTTTYKNLIKLVRAKLRNYPGYTIDITGHSAGGSHALYAVRELSQESANVRAVVFAPYIDGSYVVDDSSETTIYATRNEKATANAAIAANPSIIVLTGDVVNVASGKGGKILGGDHGVATYIAQTLHTPENGRALDNLLTQTSGGAIGNVGGKMRSGATTRAAEAFAEDGIRESGVDPRGKSTEVLQLLGRVDKPYGEQIELDRIQARVLKASDSEMDDMASQAGVVNWDRVPANRRREVLAGNLSMLAKHDVSYISVPPVPRVLATEEDVPSIEATAPAAAAAMPAAATAAPAQRVGTARVIDDAAADGAPVLLGGTPQGAADQAAAASAADARNASMRGVAQTSTGRGAKNSMGNSAKARAMLLAAPALGAGAYATRSSPLLDAVAGPFRDAAAHIFHSHGESVRGYQADNGKDAGKGILMEMFGKTNVSKTQLTQASDAIIRNYGFLLKIAPTTKAENYEAVSTFMLLACLLTRYRQSTAGGQDGGTGPQLSGLDDGELVAAVAGRTVSVKLRPDVSAAEIRKMLPPPSADKSVAGNPTGPTLPPVPKKEVITPVLDTMRKYKYTNLKFVSLGNINSKLPKVEYAFNVL